MIMNITFSEVQSFICSFHLLICSGIWLIGDQFHVHLFKAFNPLQWFMFLEVSSSVALSSNSSSSSLCPTFIDWGIFSSSVGGDWGISRGRSIDRFSFSSNLVIERIELLSGGAVEVEPPVTDKVVLVEEGSVGTEEAVLGETTGSISSADVESLAFSLRVSVVTSINLSITGKTRFRDFSVDWVIFAGDARNGSLQHRKRIRSGRIQVSTVGREFPSSV